MTNLTNAVPNTKGTVPNKPTPPEDPVKSRNRPAALYNGMIAPLVPYALRGVIWYQGESNRGQPDRYAHLFGSLIHLFLPHKAAGNSMTKER
jgi:hypothetical protein